MIAMQAWNRCRNPKQVDKEKSRREKKAGIALTLKNPSRQTTPATLPLCHYATPLFRYSATAVWTVLFALAILASCQAGAACDLLA